MSNDFSAYVPQFWALESINTLVTQNVMPSLCHRDFQDELAELGDTVNTRKPATFTTNDKVKDVDVTIQNASAANVQVTLNKHKETSFIVSERDMKSSLKNMVSSFIKPAAEAIDTQLDQDIVAAMAAGFYNHAGTAGTPPTTLAHIAAVRKVMNQKKVPFGDRRLVIGPVVEANLLVLDAFISKNYIGQFDKENEALMEAALGRKLGFDIFMDQNGESSQVSPASDTGIQTDGIQVLASTTLNYATDAGGTTLTTKPAVGDLLEISGDHYIVLTATSTDSCVVSPPLRSAYADNLAITVVGRNTTYTKLMAFHKNSTALVVRPQGAPVVGDVQAASVSEQGLSIRAMLSWEPRKLGYLVVLDILYGIKVLDGELGVIFLS